MNYLPTNREKTFVSKKGKFWCEYCDCHLVVTGQKCPNCGLRNNARRRLKKYSIN